MPNRVLRDWTDSETMNRITSQAERFFTRLIMKADDFGCFHANPKLLKAALFPLNDEIRDIDLAKWLNECANAGLVQVYKVEGKMFLQIIDFGQRLRQSRSKFPQSHEADIDSNSPPLSAIVRKSPPETETETEVETETETETDARTAHVFQIPLDEKIMNAFDEIYIDQEKIKWGHLDFNFELESFKNKVRGSPEDYQNHDRNGIRKAFQYQLRNSKGKKLNGKPTDKATEHAASLLDGYKRRHGSPTG
jgi:hypothetical protein